MILKVAELSEDAAESLGEWGGGGVRLRACWQLLVSGGWDTGTVIELLLGVGESYLLKKNG